MTSISVGALIDKLAICIYLFYFYHNSFFLIPKKESPFTRTVVNGFFFVAANSCQYALFNYGAELPNVQV